MTEPRDRRAHRLEQQDVLGRVGEMVLAADDVADGHRGVVDGHGEVVERRAVRAHDHQVAAEGVRVDLHVAANDVVEDDCPVRRNAEANHRAPTRGFEGDALGSGQVGATAAVARSLPGCLLALPLGLELLGRAVAVVGLVFGQQPRGRLRVAGQPLHLAIRAVRAAFQSPSGALLVADAGPLVPPDPQPVEAVEDVHLVGLGRTGLIGVLQAEDECPSDMAREQEVEERGSGGPKVQRPGGTRRDSNADVTHATSLRDRDPGGACVSGDERDYPPELGVW